MIFEAYGFGCPQYAKNPAVTRDELERWLEDHAGKLLFVETRVKAGTEIVSMSSDGLPHTLTRNDEGKWLLDDEPIRELRVLDDKEIERASCDADSLTVPRLNGTEWQVRGTARMFR